MQIREATSADTAAVARVHLESWQATYRGIIPEETYTALSFDERQAHWTAVLAAGGPEFVIVAEDDDGVYGIASAGPCHIYEPADAAYAGELYVLHVRPAGQRRGTGRALMQAVTRRLAAEGISSMLVWMLRENYGAQRFYAALGGRIVRETVADFMGAPMSDIAYGWADTTALQG